VLLRAVDILLAVARLVQGTPAAAAAAAAAAAEEDSLN
jgi:hypothetical protein